MEIREVAVVGLGTMGAGIAEVFARAGIAVAAIEADPAALRNGMNILEGSLSRAVSRGRMTAEERDAVAGRVRPATGFTEVTGVDLAIEVVPERPEIKRQVFAELDLACKPEAILATNTSSLSVTAVAAATDRPGRVVGLHFFNPAPVMRLVEVVGTVLTDASVLDAVTGLARRLGKTPVSVTDRAGFVANALLLPYLNHAAGLLAAGFASRADIDAAATAGLGLPMGPLALLDLIGLDTSLSIMEVLSAEFGGSRYQPAPLLRRLVAAGVLGRKTGRGFHEYPPDETQTSQMGNGTAPQPSSVTLVRSGDGPPGPLAGLLASAGIPVTATPGVAGGLVLIETAPDRDVLAEALTVGRPADTVGVYLSGDPGAPLAELVSTRLTGPAAEAAARAVAARLGLRAVRVPDRPGFLAGTLLYPHLADAVRMVQDGYASAADVDTAMTLGCGYPRGPLAMLDAAGPAAALGVLTVMHARYGDPAFAPPPLLAEHAAAGLPFRA